MDSFVANGYAILGSPLLFTRLLFGWSMKAAWLREDGPALRIVQGRLWRRPEIFEKFTWVTALLEMFATAFDGFVSQGREKKHDCPRWDKNVI